MRNCKVAAARDSVPHFSSKGSGSASASASVRIAPEGTHRLSEMHAAESQRAAWKKSGGRYSRSPSDRVTTNARRSSGASAAHVALTARRGSAGKARLKWLSGCSRG